jgi:hypothetical protein
MNESIKYVKLILTFCFTRVRISYSEGRKEAESVQKQYSEEKISNLREMK